MNSKPELFNLTSDFASVGNDSGLIQATIQIPATAIPANGTQTYQSIVNVGVAGSPINADINYSSSPFFFSGENVGFFEFSGSSFYQGVVRVYRNSPSTIMIAVDVYNSTNAPVTKIARTVTVQARSFIPPFS